MEIKKTQTRFGPRTFSDSMSLLGLHTPGVHAPPTGSVPTQGRCQEEEEVFLTPHPKKKQAQEEQGSRWLHLTTTSVSSPSPLYSQYSPVRQKSLCSYRRITLLLCALLVM